jgi:TolA-binding protein
MRRLAFTITALLMLLPIAGCRRIFQEPVPELPTAVAQYEYATGLVDLTTPLPEDRSSSPWHNSRIENPYYEVPPVKYRKRDYRRFIRAFDAVVNRFPDDTQYTPNAKVRLGEFHYLLDEYGLSANYYRDVLESYPDDEVLHSAALYGLATVRMAQGQYTDAQRIFNRLIQEHGRSQLSNVLDLVQRAQFRVFQIQHQISQ